MSSWQERLASVYGYEGAAPEWVLALTSLISVCLVLILPASAAMSYLARKLTADFQARVGPNRAGPIGLLQPLADLLKLLQKRVDRNLSAHRVIWHIFNSMVLYSTVAFLPVGSVLLLVDTDVSVFLPFLAVLLLSLGNLLTGLDRQTTVPSWFSSMRAAIMGLAGAFPALVAMLCAGVKADGFSWAGFAASQEASPLGWTLVSSPFAFLAFCVFLVSGLIILSIPPMESGMPVTDVFGGVHARLPGTRLSLYRLARFYGFFLWSLIASVIFLGAWNLPFGLSDLLREAGALRILAVLEVIVLMFKTCLLMLLTVWIARANPKIRVDQVTDLSWKVLSPISLFALAGITLWVEWWAR